jgi:SAM-dependent methyltransferase
VVGLDLDRASLHKAAGALRFRGAELGRLGAMLQGDAFHLPFRDATFDKVICSEVMEHVHDFTGAARELARVLKPGGLAAVTIPTATSEHLYLHVGDDYFESPGGHIRVFRPRQLAQGSRARASRPPASGSRTRCTRPTGCCARSPACRAPTRARSCAPIGSS